MWLRVQVQLPGEQESSQLGTSLDLCWERIALGGFKMCRYTQTTQCKQPIRDSSRPLY
jgi:hypothetical protein